MNFQPVESVELDNALAFPIAPGSALGGPIYRFLAYVPAGTPRELAFAAVGVWGVPVRIVVDMPDDWPKDDERLVMQELLKQGKMVSINVPGPDYIAVRGEFVGQTMRFATRVPFTGIEDKDRKGMYPVQVWRGPDISYGQPVQVPEPAPVPPMVPPSTEPTTPPAQPAPAPAPAETGAWAGMGRSIKTFFWGSLLLGGAAAGAWYLAKKHKVPRLAHARENPTDDKKWYVIRFYDRRAVEYFGPFTEKDAWSVLEDKESNYDRHERFAVAHEAEWQRHFGPKLPEHGPVDPKIDRTLIARVANMVGDKSRRPGAPHLSVDSGRSVIIRWLSWNDPNGSYTDAEAIGEDMDPLTLEAAWLLLEEVLEDNIASFKQR
jgi:hypothetical protein